MPIVLLDDLEAGGENVKIHRGLTMETVSSPEDVANATAPLLLVQGSLVSQDAHGRPYRAGDILLNNRPNS